MEQIEDEAQDYPVVDADGHVEEDLERITELLPPSMRPFAPRFLAEGPLGHVAFELEGRVWRSKYPFPGGRTNAVAAGGQHNEGGRDPHVRLEVLDSEGLAATVLFPSAALLFGWYENPDIAAAMCRAYNEWLAEYCAADPSRLFGVAVLPQQEPRLAAAELQRAVDDYGFVAGMVRPNKIGGRTVDHPDFEVLWEVAADLDAPVVLHEAYNHGIDTIGIDRMSTYAGCHVMSHVFEQMSSMLVVGLSGPLARHADLRLGFFEAGCGWAPTWVDRISEHFELAPDDFRGGDPAEALRTRTWLTFELDEPALRSTCELGWADNVCFASDYPHFDATFPGAVEKVRGSDLDDELLRKLLSDNAFGFFGDRLREPLSAAAI
ncbi:MAG TPA: amidohydrolase family protein [Acidimicrobiales bacterium]|nr:amidohydrolase family protein [Acidimicrobiales bacterium]